ncbi:MAG TPA: hypothetical protein VIW23_12655 [Candidatus Acidoferrum sp.]|jgi:hypothetical protein
MHKSFYVPLMLCAALLLLFTPASTRADSISGDTTVVLDSSAVTSLTGLGLSLSALGQATFDATTMTLTFPITNGTIGSGGDMFNSDGSGFSITGASTNVTFRNLVINTSAGTVSGNVHFGNTQMNGVTLFDIGAGGVLTINAQGAATLSSAFGVPDLTGTTFGTATIDVPLGSGSGSGDTTATPEPSVRSLLAASLLAIVGLAFFRSRHAVASQPRSPSPWCNQEA